MSPEKWSQGPETLSLGQRGLGDVCELPPTTPRFHLTCRTRVSGGRYRGWCFSPALERPFRSALAKRETSGDPGSCHLPLQRLFRPTEPISRDGPWLLL